MSKSFMGGVLLGAILSFAATYISIRKNQEYRPVYEAQVCIGNLENGGDELTPQLREYLKGRFYLNAYAYVHKGWFTGKKIDYGPVDRSVLGGFL